MGFIRGGLVVIASVFLFIGFLGLNTFLTIEKSLEFENVQAEVEELAVDYINESNVSDFILEKTDFLSAYCLNHTELDYSYRNQTFFIPCETVNQSPDAVILYIKENSSINSGSAQVELRNKVYSEYNTMRDYCISHEEFFLNYESYEEFNFSFDCDSLINGTIKEVVDSGVENLVEDIYYDDYDCLFFRCLKDKKPFALVSQDAKDYFNTRFYYTLIFVILISIVIFILVEKKSNFPFVFGGLLTVSAIPFYKLETVMEFFAKADFLRFLNVLFSESYNVFLGSLIIGLVIIFIGIILKFFKIGFWIQRLIEKFQKKSANSENSSEINTSNKQVKNTKATDSSSENTRTNNLVK